ncbi:MAG: type III-A CRISPR-associated RAMP protein Csm3 [Candidatus Caldarchaeum sp.]
MVRIAGFIKVNALLSCLTGLRIGGTPGGTEIGGVENVVIKDPFTQEPYIPGSSLKGAMRSKYELYRDLPLSTKLKMSIHLCDNIDCDVCIVFGRQPELVEKQQSQESGEVQNILSLTRLRVSDSYATDQTRNRWRVFGSIEVKGENALDRLTSKANPRWVERIPKDSEFEVNMSYLVFDGEGNNGKRDVERFKIVFEAMKLVEEDYLGGYGSRGYGRIKFKNIVFKVISPNHFSNPKDGVMKIPAEGYYETVDDVLTNIEDVKSQIMQFLKINSK